MTKARDLANVGAIASSGLTFRNRFINGNGAVQQRANYAISAVGAGFAADRWYTGLTSGTSIAAVGFTSAFSGSSSGKGIYVGGSYTNGTPYFAQRIEALNTQDLNGQTVTVSGLFYQETGNPVSMLLRYVKPTATDNYTGATVIATKSITFPHAVVTPFSFTTTLGSSDATLGIQFDMYTNAPVTVSSKNFGISDMQFEKGAVATPFEFRSYSVELALAQRYYEICTFSCIWSGYIVAAQNCLSNNFFKVSKRTYPTVLTTGVSVNGFPAGNPGVNTATPEGFDCYKAGPSTGYGYYQYTWTASAEI